MKIMTLSELAPSHGAVVAELCADGELRRRLLDLGLIEGSRVDCVQESPLGDPVAYRIRGAIVALRREDAAAVRVLRV